MSGLAGIDRRAVAKSFSAASNRYDAAAALQQAVREELLDRLRQFAPSAAVVLDLGCGTGAASAVLAREFAHSKVIGLDLAHGMLVQADRKIGWLDRLRGRSFARINGDTLQLPFASGSVQVIFSSLMLQWCDDLDRALREVRRVLSPGGLFLFSTFGPGTLQELRGAWAEVDELPHVNDFVDMHDLGAALTRAGFQEPVLDIDRLRREYATPRQLLLELKEIGARNSLSVRQRGLTTAARLRAMESVYRRQFACEAGVYASWEVIYASAFANAVAGEGGRSIQSDFEHVISLRDVGRRDRP